MSERCCRAGSGCLRKFAELYVVGDPSLGALKLLDSVVGRTPLGGKAAPVSRGTVDGLPHDETEVFPERRPPVEEDVVIDH